MNILKNNNNKVLSTIVLATTIMGGGILLANNTFAEGAPTTINFKDVNMCNAVAGSLSHQSIEIIEEHCSEPTPNIIMGSENINGVTYLGLYYGDISNITGIEYFKNLNHLDLNYNQVSDISPLKDLKSLTKLELWDNQISDLSPLSGLINLETLDLGNNPFNDIMPILQLNIHAGDGFIGGNYSSAITNSERYELPSLFLLFNNTLDIPEDVGPWVEEIEVYRPFLEWGFQNADINEDGKSVTIKNIDEPSEVNVYLNHPIEGRIFLAQVIINYEEPVDPDDPTDPTDDPAVPDTGKNTKESSTTTITATLCILSGIILAAIPMARRYRKTNSK